MNLNKNRLDQPGETSALVDRLDQALVEWAALHGGVWSGTAGELAVAVKAAADVADDIWPSSASALLAHISRANKYSVPWERSSRSPARIHE